MRLLTLDFLNVNSLSGHWHIDFTVSDYRTSPLFAITGSTGTGKSSILDAVSLALYGETPRVKNTGEKKKETEAGPLQKDSYDDSCPMLTKGTKEIRAGVRFEAGGRIFGSTWRRYIKRTGTLSPAQVELIEYSSETDAEGRVLTTKTSEWHKLIAEVTKMTFETFTRSVLLAQGAFSNFLKASDDARAQILEDITGTDIYSDIGRRVYLRWKDEDKKTNDMKLRLEVSAPMTKDERLAIETEAAENKMAILTARSRRDTLTAALNWRRESDKARKTVIEKVTALGVAEGKLNDYRPEAQRAEKARAALVPIRLYREGEALAHDVRELDGKRSRIADRLLALEDGRETRIAILKKTETALVQAQKAADDFALPYREMIEADTAVTALNAQKKRQTENLHHAEVKRIQTETAARSAVERETLAQRKVEADKALDEKNRADDLIEPQLTGLTASVAILQEKKRMVTELCAHTKECEAKIVRLKNAVNTALVEETADADAAQRLRSAQTEALRRYQTARGSDTPETAFQAVSDLTARMAAAGEVQRLIEDRTHFSAGLNESKGVINANETLKNFLQSTLSRFDARIAKIDTNEPGLLAQLTTGLDAYVARLTAERQAIVEHTAEVSLLRSAADKAERLAREAEITAQKSEKARVAADANLTHEKNVLADLLSKLEQAKAAQTEAHQAFKSILSSLSEGESDDEPEAILITLNEKARARRAFLNNMRKNLDTLYLARETAAVLRRDRDNARGIAEDCKKELAATESLLTERLDDRRKRFGDTDPNREKSRLAENLSQTQNAARNAEDSEREAREEIRRLTLLADNIKEQRAKNIALITARQTERDALMIKKNFSDIASLLAAELTTEEIETIEREAKQRADTVALLSGQVTQAKETYEKLEALKLSADDVETLESQAGEADGIFLEKTRKGAELAAKLEADDRKREANAEALKAIEAQVAIAGQWDRLRQLIGSADGKVFRAAAQKITFRILLQYANDAMKTMTGRYWLHAAGEGGLSVDVVDNDMGGQIRTSKNLSGGESFLVSLALALGLSRMGGKNLRVDTLFLDEGFGTLDEATLNNALYALENLQASSGKLIGIISHVKSVKDRIQNHITVTQRAGSGLSTLRGPGVTRLADE